MGELFLTADFADFAEDADEASGVEPLIFADCSIPEDSPER
jgi:hypothetical protein